MFSTYENFQPSRTLSLRDALTRLHDEGKYKRGVIVSVMRSRIPELDDLLTFRNKLESVITNLKPPEIGVYHEQKKIQSCYRMLKLRDAARYNPHEIANYFTLFVYHKLLLNKPGSDSHYIVTCLYRKDPDADLSTLSKLSRKSVRLKISNPDALHNTPANMFLRAPYYLTAQKLSWKFAEFSHSIINHSPTFAADLMISCMSAFRLDFCIRICIDHRDEEHCVEFLCDGATDYLDHYDRRSHI